MRMRALNLSQSAIEGTSDFFISLVTQDRVPKEKLVQIWASYVVRVHHSKKLAFVYLANDLIQKSALKLKKGGLAESCNFVAAFEPNIGGVLVRICELLNQQQIEGGDQTCQAILKVVNVWLTRKLYNHEHLEKL